MLQIIYLEPLVREVVKFTSLKILPVFVFLALYIYVKYVNLYNYVFSGHSIIFTVSKSVFICMIRTIERRIKKIMAVLSSAMVTGVLNMVFWTKCELY